MWTRIKPDFVNNFVGFKIENVYLKHVSYILRVYS